MRPVVSPEYGTRVQRGASTRLRAQVWLGTRNLGDVPVVNGSWQVSDADDQQVPGSVRFDVPNEARWRPTGPGHPLAGMGQQVQVWCGTDVATGTEWLPLGRYRLSAPDRNRQTLTVTGTGLMTNLERSRLLAPWTSPKGSGRKAAFGRLVGGILPWRIVGVTDETMPPLTVERERLDGLREILDAWPARMSMSDTGVLEVLPPWNDDAPGAPVVSFLDGPGGTLVSVSARPDTSSMFNGYAVSTVPDGDAAPVTETYVQPSGPLAWTGPYGQFPGFFSSPTLPANRARLRQVAVNLTQRAARRRDAYEVVAAPDPRVQVGDVARVRSAGTGVDIIGRVTAVTHARTSLTCTVAYLSGTRP